MNNQEISLKWNGYQQNILTNLKELQKDEGLSDVTLVSEGKLFKAHKVILSANSAVFKTIFQQSPQRDPIIVLHDINTESLKTILDFMYHGEVNVTEEFLPVLLKTADSLRIHGLSSGSGNQSERREEESEPLKPQKSPVSKKRKKRDSEESRQTKSKKKQVQQEQEKTVNGISNIVPKIEPVESTVSDFSNDNTSDSEIAILEDDRKYTIDLDSCPSTPNNHSDQTHKWLNDKDKYINLPTYGEKIINSHTLEKNTNILEKCINSFEKRGNSIDKCLNSPYNEKNLSSPNTDSDDKDSLEIDREVENVLQSGTMVESLSITTENLNTVSSEAQKDKSHTFPCPFCPRVYNSWGYRRRHVKSRHTTNRLTCKWCMSVLMSTGSWYSHATRSHGVPHEEARNSLVVMVEAHAVLTTSEPSVASLLNQLDPATHEPEEHGRCEVKQGDDGT